MFENENDLEKYLRSIIEKQIISQNQEIVLLKNKKIVDIVICREGIIPSIFFLEVKLFKPSNNRMGIGQGNGEGFQPEIINKSPLFLEDHLRWILVDGRRKYPEYLFMKTSEISNYLSGGLAGIKTNNIQISVFNNILALKEKQLVEVLKKWIREG